MKPPLKKHKLIAKNFQEITEISKHRQKIFLESNPANNGEISHYYHFLMDFILPVFILLKKTPPTTTFVIADFGPFSQIAKQLFGERLQVISRFRSSFWRKKTELLGVNLNSPIISSQELRLFKDYVFKKVNLSPCNNPDKILLIERATPSKTISKYHKIKGSGANRRSIKNHDEISSYLASNVKPPYTFHNVKLESISFEKQLQYFDSAALVIAQHGAGLTNLIWMQEKSTVVELGFQSRKHFEILSRHKSHQYFCQNFEKRHITEDAPELLTWMLTYPDLTPFFNE